MRVHTISAIFRRNVQSYFSGLLGYLIIIAFVFVCSLLAFNEQFFGNNLATLDQLSRPFPLLLLFLVPAITMSVWADERKASTDELLFTLPASDTEVLLGKYLSVLAVYSIALLFSMTILIVLNRLGHPDWGTVCSTYFGYWLAGAALLSAGMFASSLTDSTTVAFILGVLFSAVPVFLAPVAEFLTRFGPGVADVARSLALSEQLRPFTEGLIPLSGILYFASLAAFMLYLNLVVVTKRHWSGGKQARMGAQYATRVVALAVSLISFNVMLQKGKAHVPRGVDLSAERVHTLSPVTRKLITKAVANEHAITIQAFLSPEVPDEFVPVRKQLVNLLRQYDRLGGKYLTVRFVDVTHASAEETDAKTQGIERINYKLEDRKGRVVEQDVYLGVVVTGHRRKVVIPSFRNRVQVEYELTRSLGTLLGAEKLRVGILRTDARVLFPLNRNKHWYFDRFLQELEKQYEVIDVSHADLEAWAQPAEKAGKNGKQPSKGKTANKKGQDDAGESEDGPQPPDVLIVVQATSLPQVVMENLVKYMQRGHPAIIFDDPLPFYLVYDQSDIDERLRGQYFEIIEAPRLRRPHPRSFWALEQISDEFVEKVNDWLREGSRMRMVRSQSQFERLLRQGTEQIYPELVPQVSGAAPVRKADAGTAEVLMRALGLTWDNGEVVTDTYAPHPDFNADIPEGVAEDLGPHWPVTHYGQKENALLFIGRGHGYRHALNAEHPVTQQLKEVLAIYAGSVHQRTGSPTNVVPLLQTSSDAELIKWDDLTVKMTRSVVVPDDVTGRPVRRKEEIIESRITNNNNRRRGPRGQLQPVLNPQLFPRQARYVLANDPRRTSAEDPQTIAVLVTPDDDKDDESKSSTDDSDDSRDPGKLKAVFVADIDMISDVFFRQQEALGQPLDNMNFVMNAIESLVGEEQFIELRSRRPEPRTLVTIQNAVRTFRKQRREEEEKIKKQTEDQVQKAQQRFEEQVKKIQQSQDLDVLQKGQMQVMAFRTESERLEAEKQRLQERLDRRVAELKNAEDRQIRQYQNRIRMVAVALTPLPALLLGLGVLVVRWTNERRQVVPARRM